MLKKLFNHSINVIENVTKRDGKVGFLQLSQFGYFIFLPYSVIFLFYIQKKYSIRIGTVWYWFDRLVKILLCVYIKWRDVKDNLKKKF